MKNFEKLQKFQRNRSKSKKYTFFMSGKNRRMKKHEEVKQPYPIPGSKGQLILPGEGGTDIPTDILGACSICHILGTLDIRVDRGDLAKDAFDRKPVESFCPKCRQMTEFIPAPLDVDTADAGYKWIANLEKQIGDESEKERSRLILP